MGVCVRIPKKAIGGEPCGGESNIDCQLPSVCHLESDEPDATGICVIELVVGESCGGKRRIPAECQSNLVCQVNRNSNNELASDAVGVCALREVGIGEKCGNYMINAPVCKKGLFCNLTQIPDIGGICGATRKAGLGEHCGGFIANAVKCNSGLVCKLDVSKPDVGGVCVYQIVKNIEKITFKSIVKTLTLTKTASKISTVTKSNAPIINGIGGSCGGFVAPPVPECSPGLICKYDSNNGANDIPGR
ncbi:hypothetical protein HK096_007821, partial [Nowakowskiella sp. JEL0078]